MKKFPRTPHIKGSKGTPDDIFESKYLYEGLVIATEKMDGTNLTLGKDNWFLRSGNSKNQDWTYPINEFYYTLKDKIKDGDFILGEFLHWTKSVYYDNLDSNYYMFGVNRNNTVLSWEETKKISKKLNIPLVKELSKIGYFENVVKEAKNNISKTDNIEGFVIRPIDSFSFDEYGKYVRKFVKSDFEGIRESKGKNKFKENWNY